MRTTMLSSVLMLVVAFTPLNVALRALSSSPCASLCGNTLNSTTGADLVCQMGDFSGMSQGIVYQNCVTCQLSSKFVDPVTQQTDLQWALYNLRWAVSWCLFGFGGNKVESTPCTTSPACGPLQYSFEYDSLRPDSSSYQYCALMNQNQLQIPKCEACLEVQSNEFYLTNFVTALNAGCQQQPTPGNTITLDGSIFNSSITNITNPSVLPSSNSRASRGNSLSAIIWIVIGNLLFIAALAGCFIVLCGKRRRRAYLKKCQMQTGYPEWLASQEAMATHGARRLDHGEGYGGSNEMMSPVGAFSTFFESPQSQRPLVTGHFWNIGGATDDDSPSSGVSQEVFFGPYSSQHKNHVSAQDLLMTSREWPLDRGASVVGSTTVNYSKPAPQIQQRGHSGERTKWDQERQPLGERFEMQHFDAIIPAPMHHPQPVYKHEHEQDSRMSRSP